jgi:hypothetical protein
MPTLPGNDSDTDTPRCGEQILSTPGYGHLTSSDSANVTRIPQAVPSCSPLRLPGWRVRPDGVPKLSPGSACSGLLTMAGRPNLARRTPEERVRVPARADSVGAIR